MIDPTHIALLLLVVFLLFLFAAERTRRHRDTMHLEERLRGKERELCRAEDDIIRLKEFQRAWIQLAPISSDSHGVERIRINEDGKARPILRRETIA